MKSNFKIGMSIYSFNKVPAFCFLLLTFFLFSCIEDEILQVNPNSEEVVLGVYYTDSLELRTYITMDSVNTTNTGVLQAGMIDYSSMGLGKTTSETYFQLLALDTLAFTSASEYLSGVLKVRTSIIGDSTTRFIINVHEVLEKIDSITYYQTDVLDEIGDLLISQEFERLSGTGSDTLVEIDLGAFFGEKILNQNGNDSIRNEEEFLDYIKGLRITATPKNGASGFLNFQASSLNYQLKVVENLVDTLSSFFLIGQNFNHIASDFTGTALEGMQIGDTTSSEDIGNVGFLQSGIGLKTIIELPELHLLTDDFSSENSIIKINHAQLAFVPVDGSIDTSFPPPSVLTFELSEKDTIALNTDNQLDNFALSNLGYARNVFGGVSLNTQSGSGISYNISGKSYPLVDITSYCQILLDEPNRIAGSFKLIPTGISLSTKALKIGGAKFPTPADHIPSMQKPAMRLEVYYTVIDILR